MSLQNWETKIPMSLDMLFTFTCRFPVTSLVSKPGNWQLLKVTQKLHRHPISGCLMIISTHQLALMWNECKSAVNRLRFSGRETNICLSAFDLNWLKSCEPEEWKCFWLALQGAHKYLASQLVLLHLLLCQSLSYCLQLCLSDRVFPQALSLHKQMHVPIFPSVCAASSASLMDTCQKDSAQTLGQTPPLHDFGYFQHFTLHSLLSACAACRHATKQTERTLLRSKPVKIRFSYSLHSSPMNLDATNISSINHICMATLFLKHVQTPSTSSLALDKAKTDHIHCNLPRLGVLSFCDKPQ